VSAPVPSPSVLFPAVLATPLGPGVGAALARLESLEGACVSKHVEVFDGVHRLLQDALATLDEA